MHRHQQLQDLARRPETQGSLAGRTLWVASCTHATGLITVARLRMIRSTPTSKRMETGRKEVKKRRHGRSSTVSCYRTMIYVRCFDTGRTAVPYRKNDTNKAEHIPLWELMLKDFTAFRHLSGSVPTSSTVRRHTITTWFLPDKEQFRRPEVFTAEIASLKTSPKPGNKQIRKSLHGASFNQYKTSNNLPCKQVRAYTCTERTADFILPGQRTPHCGGILTVSSLTQKRGAKQPRARAIGGD